MTATAIIQARMGSSRFPGKMLAELAGRPVLWHIVHRLRRCATVGQIILATSDGAGDDPLAAYAGTLGVTVVRGPEANVLRRFALALEHSAAPVVLRICGDSVLIDPWLIDRLVTLLVTTGGDYPQVTTPCSDCGIDAVSRALLARIIAEKAEHPIAIEHVTGYLGVDPGFGTVAELALPDQDRALPGARFSIDTPADLAFMRALYRETGAATGELGFLEAIAWLKAHPALIAINAYVRQRQGGEHTPVVVIRCDAGHALGIGHLVRCLAIASVLRDRFSAAVTFALGGDPAPAAFGGVPAPAAFGGVPAPAALGGAPAPAALGGAPALAALAREQAFPVAIMAGADPAGELAAVLARTGADTLLMDLRTPYDAGEIAAIRAAGCRFAVLDDGGERRLAADLGYYPPAGAALDWTGAQGRYVAGWDWLPLRPSFSPPPPWRPQAPPLALILVGGSDPHGLRSRLLRVAAAALPPEWRITLVLGRATIADPGFDVLATGLGVRLTIAQDVADMAALMAGAALALSVFGGTAYELAAVGVPAILLGLDADHARSAAALAEAGAALSLGVAGAVDDETLAATIAALAAAPDRRARISATARALIDGQGAYRIAGSLLEGRCGGTA